MGFKSTKSLIRFFEVHGVEKGKIQAISIGDQGCYVFFSNKEEIIIKHKLYAIGVSYVDEDEVLKFLNDIYFPAIGKAHNKENEDIIL